MVEVRMLKTPKRQENAETPPVVHMSVDDPNRILLEACGCTCNLNKLG